jgi:dTDP-4-amino-4,6-dideoxygalactose transaminase
MKINWVPNKKINNNIVDKLIINSLKDNQFANYGPNVQLLEKIIREKLQINNDKSVIAVTNGSVALHSLTSSIKYYHNKEINWATQSFTFPPSAQSNLSNVKIVDIDLDGGIDLKEIDDLTDGIIVTNIFGNVVDIDKYEKWANNNDKFLIFDNAATPFTFYKGQSSCNYGTGCTVSFHHTKPLGFGEGGAIIVDKKYEKYIRCLNNFGIGLTSEYWVREGNNNKMSDISAIYIIQYLDMFDNIVKKHQKLYDYFIEKIKENNLNNKLKLFPNFGEKDKTLLSCFSILFDEYDDNIRLKLLENNIFCRKYYEPLIKSKNAINIYNRILCVPCNVDMTFENIDFIFSLL